MDEASMGMIEKALFSAAFRRLDGYLPSQPIEPELDCFTQALGETCRLYGLSNDDISRFMMSLAVKVRRLDAEVPDRLRLREVEAKMMETCGLGRRL